MSGATLTLKFDASGLNGWLAALSELAERLPEVRDGLLGLLDSSEELIRFDVNSGPATVANEVTVRPYPSDALFGLLSAVGAGDSDLLLFEHNSAPEVESMHDITTSQALQSGDVK